ncbi:MAG: hemerythrin domain-containing protein [Acidimicrobiia bacterium]
MSTGFEHLHREHEELRTALERLRITAEQADRASADELHAMVVADRRFLVDELLPHAAGEAEILYPAIQRVLKSPRATVGMEHDHHHVELLALEIGGLEEALARAAAEGQGRSVDEQLAHDIRRVFYSLWAVIVNHFEKEERVYAPLLAAAMNPDEAQRMTDELEAAVAARKAQASSGA